MLLHEFFQRAESRYMYNGISWGQSFSYELDSIRPDLAKKIYRTDCDPFLVSKNRGIGNPQWDRFVAFIHENWNKELPQEEQ